MVTSFHGVNHIQGISLIFVGVMSWMTYLFQPQSYKLFVTSVFISFPRKEKPFTTIHTVIFSLNYSFCKEECEKWYWLTCKKMLKYLKNKTKLKCKLKCWVEMYNYLRFLVIMNSPRELRFIYDDVLDFMCLIENGINP